MDDRETMLIPLSLLGESCPFGNVSISLSCQNDFASIWCSPSLGYVFEHPKAGFTSQWICGVSFTCQYWTCVLKTALHSGLPYCFIFHACQLQVIGGLCFQHFVSNIGGIVKLVHDENRGDRVYWDFNSQDCLQDLFSVIPCYFLLNDFIF